MRVFQTELVQAPRHPNGNGKGKTSFNRFFSGYGSLRVSSMSVIFWLAVAQQLPCTYTPKNQSLQTLHLGLGLITRFYSYMLQLHLSSLSHKPQMNLESFQGHAQSITLGCLHPQITDAATNRDEGSTQAMPSAAHHWLHAGVRHLHAQGRDGSAYGPYFPGPLTPTARCLPFPGPAEAAS